MIQASSAESERHFSAGGQIVAEKRSRLSPQSVESLVVLREAYINGQWPETDVAAAFEGVASEHEL